MIVAVRIVVAALSAAVLTLAAVGWSERDSAASYGVCLIEGAVCVPVQEK